MRIARLATAVAAGACLVGAGTVALVHASGPARSTLVSSSAPGFDSPRDIAERGTGPTAIASADPSPTANPTLAATPAPATLAPAPTAQPVVDADDEANEPAEPAEPAEANEANDADHQADGHDDDGTAQTQSAPAGTSAGDDRNRGRDGHDDSGR